MTLNYNLGSDTTLTIVAGGAVLATKILTGFTAKQMTAKIVSKAIDGVNRPRDVEEMWEGTFDWDRTDNSLDLFFAAKEAARFAGQAPPVVTITETSVDANTGAPSVMKYTGVTMTFEDIGKRAGDSKVDQRVSWRASRRKAG